MKKRFKILLPLLTLSLIGCSPIAISTSTNSSKVEIEDSLVKSITLNVTGDYGNYIRDKMTLLYGDTLPFFDVKDYGYNMDVYIGCSIELQYRGEYRVKETYPSTCETSLLEIVGVKVIYGRVIQYKVTNNELIPTSEIQKEYTDFQVERVIDKNSNYTWYSSYPDGTLIYGVIPAYVSGLGIYALYSYDVRGIF